MEKQEKRPNSKLRRERELRGWSQRAVAERVGTSEQVVVRWESGEHKPNRHFQTQLCELFGKNAEELGFLETQTTNEEEEEQSHTCQEQQELSSSFNTENDPMKRREMFELLGETAGSLLVMPGILEADAIDRLIRELEKPSSLDTTAISSLESLTKHNWRLLYSGVPWSALLGGVSGHIQTLTSFLKGSLPTSMEQRLYILISQEAQMAGEIYFDMRNYKQAQEYFAFAVEAARKADNQALTAVAIGRINVRPSDKEALQKYIALLKVAHRLAEQGATVTTRAWLAAREAEAQANIGDANACLEALDKANIIDNQSLVEDDPFWTHFSPPSLVGYKGVCYVRLRHPYAQDVLLEALTTLPSRQATTLVDLANSYAQTGEIEEACKRASQALVLTEHNQSANTLQRIKDFRPELDLWSNSPYVKNLDAQIAAVGAKLRY